MTYRDAAATLVSLSLILANVFGWAAILKNIIVWA